MQSHLSASRHPQRHPSSINLSHAAPVHVALQPRPSTVGQQMPNAQNGPPVPQQGGLQQPWGLPPPHLHQAPQPAMHFQPGGRPPMHGFPGAPYQGGKVYSMYPQHCCSAQQQMLCCQVVQTSVHALLSVRKLLSGSTSASHSNCIFAALERQSMRPSVLIAFLSNARQRHTAVL